MVGCDAVKKGIILFGSQEILRSRIIYIYRILYDKRLRPLRNLFVLDMHISLGLFSMWILIQFTMTNTASVVCIANT